MERNTRAVLTISGSVISLIGAFLPWYTIKFDPPGGYAIVDGKRYTAVNNIYSVMNLPSASPESVVRTAVFALLCLGLLDALSLFFSEESAANVTQHIAHFLHWKFIQGVKGFIQAFALLIEALGWLSLTFLAVFPSFHSFFIILVDEYIPMRFALIRAKILTAHNQFPNSACA